MLVEVVKAVLNPPIAVAVAKVQAAPVQPAPAVSVVKQPAPEITRGWAERRPVQQVLVLKMDWEFEKYRTKYLFEAGQQIHVMERRREDSMVRFRVGLQFLVLNSELDKYT